VAWTHGKGKYLGAKSDHSTVSNHKKCDNNPKEGREQVRVAEAGIAGLAICGPGFQIGAEGDEAW